MRRKSPIGRTSYFRPINRIIKSGGATLKPEIVFKRQAVPSIYHFQCFFKTGKQKFKNRFRKPSFFRLIKQITKNGGATFSLKSRRPIFLIKSFNKKHFIELRLFFIFSYIFKLEAALFIKLRCLKGICSKIDIINSAVFKMLFNGI